MKKQVIIGVVVALTLVTIILISGSSKKEVVCIKNKEEEVIYYFDFNEPYLLTEGSIYGVKFDTSGMYRSEKLESETNKEYLERFIEKLPTDTYSSCKIK